MSNIVPKKHIENKIYLLRNKRVMLDRDLAKLYGVPTKSLNLAVKRNKDRFPSDEIPNSGYTVPRLPGEGLAW